MISRSVMGQSSHEACLKQTNLLIEARRCDCTRSQCGAARASRRHGRGNAHIDGFACLDPLFPLQQG